MLKLNQFQIILLSILLICAVNCSFPKEGNKKIHPHDNSSVFSSIDSDSLLIYSPELVILVNDFVHNGIKPAVKLYSEGDVSGKVKIFSKGTDTLIIDKYDSGQYGFGNSEYLFRNDSLRIVRNYRYDWSLSDTFCISEYIYDFDKKLVLERKMFSRPWTGFSLNKLPFKYHPITDSLKYEEFTKEIKRLIQI